MRARAVLLLFLTVLAPLASSQPAEPTAPPAVADYILVLEPGVPTPRIDLPHHRVQVVDAIVVFDAPASALEGLARLPGVIAAHRAVPLERHQVAGTAAGYAGERDHNLRLTRADEVTYTGQGVTVAVVDSGIDATHPDLQGRVTRNVRLVEGAFVDTVGDADGHGTHVAGIIGASGASSQGRVAGIAPRAQLVGLDISSRFTTASALMAYDWLFLHRPTLELDVVVNAWGRVGREPFDATDPVVRAIDRLVAEGVVVLFSASNHGPRASSLSLEAQNPRVITVGAVDAAGVPQDYSSRGPVWARGDTTWVKPDVVAPGERVVGLRSMQRAPRVDDPDAAHTIMSGTSQAVPHVAGIVALMLQANRSLSPADVTNALRASAIDVSIPGPDDRTGFGLVDAVDALRQATGKPNTRGNALVSGGVERYADSGAAAPTPRAANGLLGVRRLEAEAWHTTFPVKQGAAALTFDLAWTNAANPPRVTLDLPDGTPAGSWSAVEAAGGVATVRGRLDEPTPGVYALRVHAAVPATTRATAIIDVHLRANASRALELDSRYELPSTAWNAPEAAPLAARIDAWLASPSMLGLLCAMVVLALASRAPPLRLKRAQSPSRDEGASAQNPPLSSHDAGSSDP